MRLALLSDIHANIQAFETCLAHAQAQGASRLAFLGDLVGYGADPAAVLERVQALVGAGALAVKGNHDAMAVTPPAPSDSLGSSTAAWTHAQLSPAQRGFLDQLPLTCQLESVLLVHASVDAPERWRYVHDVRSASASLEAAGAYLAVRHVFGGHVHEQSLYYRGGGGRLMRFKPTPGVAVPVPKHRHWLATVGSVGQPRDGLPLAMYALLDTDTMALTFHRVAYNHTAAASAIRRAGLPAFFANRLGLGR